MARTLGDVHPKQNATRVNFFRQTSLCNTTFLVFHASISTNSSQIQLHFDWHTNCVKYPRQQISCSRCKSMMLAEIKPRQRFESPAEIRSNRVYAQRLRFRCCRFWFPVVGSLQLLEATACRPLWCRYICTQYSPQSATVWRRQSFRLLWNLGQLNFEEAPNYSPIFIQTN